MIAEFTREYRWLSNFHPCRIKLGGMVYPSAEHAYQAAKFLDPKIRRTIQAMTSPSQAKGYASKIQKARVREDWDTIKLDVMRAIVTQKFTYYAELRQLLIDTGDQEIVEGNYWGDTYWGVCKGEGENHLGKLLMELRASLTSSPAKKVSKPRKSRAKKAIEVKGEFTGESYEDDLF